MKMSAEIGALAAALAKAQGEMKNPTRDAANPFFKSRYAPLDTVIDADKGPLSKNGLAVIQSLRTEGKLVFVTTVIAHSSGQWIELDPAGAEAKDAGAQAIGSAATYLRRYTRMGATGTAATNEDDDGEAAEGRQTQPVQANGKAPSRTEAVKEQVKAATKGKTEDRKHQIVARMGKLGFDAAAIGGWVNKTLGKGKAETGDDLDKLEAAVADLEAGREVLGAAQH